MEAEGDVRVHSERRIRRVDDSTARLTSIFQVFAAVVCSTTTSSEVVDDDDVIRCALKVFSARYRFRHYSWRKRSPAGPILRKREMCGVGVIRKI